jgi:purine-cytosine permease-like protein|tara:strand:- start:840 stop:1037 length:198 start_codon:yes stop_codon:yes gene_type:complete
MDLSFLVKNKIVINIFRIIVIWIIVAVARNFVEEKVENILTILGFVFTIIIILGLASYWFWKKYK